MPAKWCGECFHGTRCVNEALLACHSLIWVLWLTPSFMPTIYPPYNRYFQHDGAPCHKVSNWFLGHGSEFNALECPPLPRDLNPTWLLWDWLQNAFPAQIYRTKSTSRIWWNHVKSMLQRTKAVLRAKTPTWFRLPHDLKARLPLSDPAVVAFSFMYFKIYWAVALMRHSREWNTTPSLHSENRAVSNGGGCGCWRCLQLLEFCPRMEIWVALLLGTV